ncbi:glycoside hydrolase family 28 protein [Cohnella sp.]|uniref:glycoside hydrolase family 28 protein n=1 Tax=Cohnella sp. TaxID=1883426 RepID=UPI0035637CCA
MSSRFEITSFGAVGDGQTDNTIAIRSAIESCAASCGGTVYVPAGTYATGPIELVSGMTLYLETGAVLRFSNRFELYPPTFTRWSGYECYGYHPLLYGRNLERISIKGEGVIDGQGQAWWDAYGQLKQKESSTPKSPYREQLMQLNESLYSSIDSTFAEWETQLLRPPLLQLMDCKGVTLEGVTLQNSPFWNTHLVYCDEVKVSRVTFRNPSDTPNGDGLDVDSCTNVSISDCQFDVGDDCLCLKSGINEDGRRVGRPTENVVVTNCIMRRGHGGIVLGSEMSGDIRRIVVSNCIFLGTDRGFRVKTNRARGGVIEDVMISHIYMEDVLCPIAVNSFYRYGVSSTDPLMTTPEPIPVTECTPVVRRLTISDITVRNARAAAAFVYGLPEQPIEDVTIRNVTIEMTSDVEELGGEPDMVKEKLVMAGDGMLFKHVRSLELYHVRIETRQGPAVRLDNVEGAVVDGLSMRVKHPNTDVLVSNESSVEGRV